MSSRIYINKGITHSDRIRFEFDEVTKNLDLDTEYDLLVHYLDERIERFRVEGREMESAIEEKLVFDGIHYFVIAPYGHFESIKARNKVRK